MVESWEFAQNVLKVKKKVKGMDMNILQNLQQQAYVLSVWFDLEFAMVLVLKTKTIKILVHHQIFIHKNTWSLRKQVGKILISLIYYLFA